MDDVWFRELAYGAMQALQSTALTGSPSERTKAVLARMEALLPGDWVVEVSSALYRKADSGVGRLILKREEPMPGEWDPEEGAPMEVVWYVETPEGTLARWVNASFLSLPVDSAYDEKWARDAAQRHGLHAG